MLKSVHPLPKLIVCFIWIGASTLIFDATFQAATIIIAAATLLIFNRTPLRIVLLLMIPFALFGFGFLTTSLIFREDSGPALGVFNADLLNTPALYAGITLFLRAIAGGMISAVFALSTEPGGLIKSLMHYWRFPPRLGYALFSAMQLMPDLASEAMQIRLARAMHTGRHPRRIPGPRETFSLAIPLLAFAIRRAGRTAIAMEARGLAPGGKRTIVGVPQPGKIDIWFCAIAAALMLSSLLPFLLSAG